MRMSNYVFLQNIAEQIGKEITVKGWVFNVRSSGKIAFLQFRDGGAWLQAVVVKDQVDLQSWQAAQTITIESSVELTGTIREDKRSAFGYEMDVKVVKVLQVAAEYPIGKKEHGPDFLLDNRHLWLRAQTQWAIQRVRNELILATYDFFKQNGFIKIDSPILTPNSCEGTSTLFTIDYFGRPAYLTQSGQLYLEAAIAAHGRVFDFGPVFRAEKSKTRRHLTEFWMMDAEVAFNGQDENLAVQENLISFMVQRVLKNRTQELIILERDTKVLQNVKAPFYRMTHAEAVQKLHELGSDIKADDDLGADDETLLMQSFDKPLFVEKYPAVVKAFYMKRDPDDPSRVLCADMLAPEGYGEIIGGSVREDNYEELIKRLKDSGLDEKTFSWYLDLRKYGSVPHAGFGYGLERIVAWVCGLKHVRETIPFPRLINRLEP